MGTVLLLFMLFMVLLIGAVILGSLYFYKLIRAIKPHR